MSNLKQDSLDYHSQGRPGKLKIVATKPMDTQRDLALAYSPGVAYPVLAIADDPALAYRIHGQGQSRGRHQQRHRHPRPGQPRPPGRQTGHGGQGGPLQALRRCRRLRHRGQQPRPRRNRPLRRDDRPHLRRHQPGGHQGAGVLLHRAGAAEAGRYPRLPRRPARHRHHLRRRAHQCAGTGGQAHGRGQDRPERRRSGVHRHRRSLCRPRRPAREHRHGRHQGRHLQGAHRRDERV